MAKLSSVVKNNQRKKLVAKFLTRRIELRKKANNLNLNEEDRATARRQLEKLPRDSCENRVRNRCELTGRARGYYRNFKLSRITFRELALRGMIPGVTKASW